MPIEMPKESLITIQKRTLSADFMMPQMELAASHYSIGYLISGDRRIITPHQQVDFHPGDMTAMSPMIYHRTFPLSREPYVNYLIKISAELAEEFAREIDPKIWQDVFEPISLSFHPDDSKKAQELIADMLEVYEEKADYSMILLKGMLYRLIILMWEKHIKNGSQRFRATLSNEIMEVMYFVEQNYSDDIRLNNAAEIAGFSEGHLSRQFSTQVGVPFSEYLVNVRLRHVKEQLLHTDLPISEIAFRTGFTNADYLSACFHRHEGMTPTAFRKGSVR